ncbi:MAG: pyridoxine 5'-phosphate synthase [Alloprevotella sp.]|nr:pyridoxine 5'-phosphate synthase [Alloprevotella sp.]
MTKLSVNVNKIATLRNARGGNNPDLIEAVRRIEEFGAQGITIHPRPDERHIRHSDVYALKQVVGTELNIEGYPSPEFLEMVCEVGPTQATLVPDKPDQLTSNHGWDTVSSCDFLRECVARLHSSKIRVSLFVDANSRMVEGAACTGADRVELYTGPYAEAFADSPAQAIAPYVAAAEAADRCGLGLNAGHDLSLANLRYFHEHIANLDEVSIGHALICDALYMGLEATVKAYLEQLL